MFAFVTTQNFAPQRFIIWKDKNYVQQQEREGIQIVKTFTQNENWVCLKLGRDCK